MIDVSELMTDPDFGATTFTRRRPTMAYINEGTAKPTYEDELITGIVQPASTKDAVFLPQGVLISDVQAFFVTGGISVGDTEELSDLLVHKGRTYRALHVADFDNHGMCRALAKLLPVEVVDDGS